MCQVVTYVPSRDGLRRVPLVVLPNVRRDEMKVVVRLNPVVVEPWLVVEVIP